jgi:GNAT superfamily N-acetyltransferase
MCTIDIRIERATGRHKRDVLKLLAEHIPQTDVARRYEWLYEQNPHGRAVTVIAYGTADGEPLGITSVFPRKVLVSGEPMLGSIGGDGYVRPLARRRGVATALHNASLSAMREAGIQLMFGPPEPHNLRALLRAGSRVVTTVCRYARPGALQRVSRCFSGMLRKNNTVLSPLEGVDSRVLEVWERAVSPGMVMPVRDPAHYAWRFGAAPSGTQKAFAVMQDGHTRAICALERRGRRVAIVDLLAPRDGYAGAVRAVADACDADVVTTQMNERSPEAWAFFTAGFLPRETKFFQVLAPESAHPALFDAARWYYTWGDGDVDSLV